MAENDLVKVINLSPKTITNYHKQQKSLEPLPGEHLLKLIVLFEKGEENSGNSGESAIV